MDLDAFFNTIFNQFCHICKWAFVFKCSSDIVKRINSGFDISEVAKIVFAYVAGYAFLFYLVRLFDSVEGMIR